MDSWAVVDWTKESDSTVDDLKKWVDDNYCSKDVNGNIDLSRYALIDDVHRAFSELASALSGV